MSGLFNFNNNASSEPEPDFMNIPKDYNDAVLAIRNLQGLRYIVRKHFSENEMVKFDRYTTAKPSFYDQVSVALQESYIDAINFAIKTIAEQYKIDLSQL